MYVVASSAFEAVFESGITGLVPGIEVAIIDNVGNVVVAGSGVGITEQVVDANPNTGIYAVTLTAPAAVGQYSLVWSTDGSFGMNTVSIEDLVIEEAGSVLPPIGVPADGLADGPCSMWANVADVSDCCTLPEGLDPVVLVARMTAALTAASQLLYETSGRRYAGTCQRVVRPCQTSGCGFVTQVLSRGHLVGQDWGYWGGDYWGNYDCGCQPLSRVKLAGIVRSIVQVKIGGVVVNPTEYRVDEARWLVRKNGSHWPACQALDLDDDQPGTFSVTYTYGRIPSLAGQNAAVELACELFKACTNQECSLPTGVTRVTRQGITFERAFLQRDRNGVWRSGLPQVDLYLNSVNPHGIRRRAVVWSPSRQGRYARGAGD